MIWNKTWDEVFKLREWGKYPDNDLINFMNKNKKIVKVLDLGCGTGANSWYLSKEGYDVKGIDGSKTAIKLCKKRIEENGLKANFNVGDFIELPYRDNSFDLVIDISSIQHNQPEHHKDIIKEIRRVLKPEGMIFSKLINNQSRFNTKELDAFTHFFRLNEIRDIFSTFSEVSIDISEYTDKGNIISHFIVGGTNITKQ